MTSLAAVQPIHIALLFTVILLAITFYFLLGGTPLLILKHDVAMDAKFTRSFFNLYFRMATVAALGATLFYGLAHRTVLAVGACVLTALILLLRQRFIPAMERWGGHIQAQDGDVEAQGAIAAFRRVHKQALLFNLVQIIVLVWSFTQLKL